MKAAGVRRPSAFTKTILRSIRGSLGRFLAILGIVALGCGFYAGLQMCGPDMRAAADSLYDGTNLYDIRLVSTLGFTASDVERVEKIEGVDGVMAAVTCDVMAHFGTGQHAVRMSSLDVGAADAKEQGANVILSDDGNYLNRVFLREGRWPTAADECVISADKVFEMAGMGDAVEVLYGTSDLDDVLVGRTFTIVGTVSSPYYPYTGSFGSTTLGSGMIADYVYVAPTAFVEDAPFTEIYLRVEGADAYESGSDDYKEAVAVVRERLEAQERALATARLEDVRAAAQKTLDEEQRKAEDELADAKKQLDDAKSQLDSGQREYDEGLAAYESGRATANAELSSAQATIDSRRRELDAAKAQLSAAEATVPKEVASFLASLAAEGISASDLASARTQLASSRDQLTAVLAAIDALSSANADVERLEASYAEYERLARSLANASSVEERRSSLNALLATAQQTLAEAEERAAQSDSEEARRYVEQARARVQELERQLAEAERSADQAASYEEIRKQVATELEAARKRLEEAQARGDDLPARSEVQARLAQVNEALAGLSQLEAAQAQLVSAREQIASGESQLASAQTQLDAQRTSVAAELRKAKSELDAAKTKLADGKEEYEDGLAEYEQAKADAEEQLADAQEKIDELEAPDIYVLDRSQSEGALTYDADTHRMDSIADVFPLIFFLVAALVALTTMTRMVDDDRVEIGTYKALGYSTARIASKYLSYAGIASLVGATLGILVLSQVLPIIVTSAYSIIYTVPVRTVALPIDVGTALMSGGMGVGVTLAATWAAVVASLREVPATLMLPRAPAAGKRILLERMGPVWRRFSFSWKVTSRNLFRYKRRLAMTVIGISGCTALLLVGFGLHDAIWDIIDGHYGPVVHYNTVVGLNADATARDVTDVVDYLRGTGDVDDIVRAQQENMQAGTATDDEKIRVSVVIPQSESSMPQAITFRERVSGDPIAFGEESVVLTEKTALKYGLSVGDPILLFDQDAIGNVVGDGHELTITGICESYVGNVVYVGRKAWKTVDGTVPVFSTIYAKVEDSEEVREAIADELHARDTVSTVVFSDETINLYRNMLSVVDMIVVLLIVSAGLLAFIVLYNLTNINIGERVREIASLKVLGFTRGEVYAYIFREIALLALLGDLLGMVLGTWLATFVITTAEVDYVMFGRTIHPTSYAWSFALTMVFTGVILLLMRHKLDQVNMVESLKSVE